MNPDTVSSQQIEALHDIEMWLHLHPDEKAQINAAVFGVANKMLVHPHDVAIYILIRTASI